MPDIPEEDVGSWADAFSAHQGRLLALAARCLHPVLARRFSPEDVVQEAMTAACKRSEFFENNPEIPIYFKLRIILLQVVTDLERKNLQCQKRDAYREVEMGDGGDDNPSVAQRHWDQFADTMTGPLSRLVRAERHGLLRNAFDALSESDRRILTLRHFDGLANAECAAVLGINPKAASIRYIRAVERLKNKLVEMTEFKT